MKRLIVHALLVCAILGVILGKPRLKKNFVNVKKELDEQDEGDDEDESGVGEVEMFDLLNDSDNEPPLDYSDDSANDCALDSESDDEFSNNSVESFIVGQKRKYASYDQSKDLEPSPKRRSDSLSSSSSDSELNDFDAVYRDLLMKPGNCDCGGPPTEAGDRRKRKDRLRVASFNAEWLFLFGGLGSVACPGRGCPWTNLKKAKKHFFKVLKLISKLDADIVHLNEVEDCRVLEAILLLLPEGHGYAAYMTPGTDTMTGQNVALLTRIDPSVPLKRSSARVSYPIAGSSCGLSRSFSKGQGRSGHCGLSKHYLAQFEISLSAGKTKPRRRSSRKYCKSRTVLEESEELTAKSHKFTLLMAGAHFIAQPENADRCLRREAQATVLNRLLQGNLDSLKARNHPLPVELLITGDFNDHDGEALGASGEMPLSTTLKVLKKVSGRTLFTSASWISEQQDRYTSWHDKNRNCRDDGAPEHSLIDHVLLSKGLMGRLQTVWMDHNETVSCAKRTSDHFPIILEIK